MFLMFFYLVKGFGIKKFGKRGENGQKCAFLQISEFAAANWMFAPANVFAPAKPKSAPADPCMHSPYNFQGRSRPREPFCSRPRTVRARELFVRGRGLVCDQSPRFFWVFRLFFRF